jgi:hypothetical protein
MYNIKQQPIFPFDFRSDIKDPENKAVMEKVYTLLDELVAKFNGNAKDLDNNIGSFGKTQTVVATDRLEHICDTYEVIAKTPLAGVTLTSTPTVSAGYQGQRVVYIGTSATRTVKLQDETSLPGTLLDLGGADVTLGLGDTIQLIYSSTIGKWVRL